MDVLFLTSALIRHQTQTPSSIQAVRYIHLDGIRDQQTHAGNTDFDVQIVVRNVHHLPLFFRADAFRSTKGT